MRRRWIGWLVAIGLLAVSCGSSGKTLAPAATPEATAEEVAAPPATYPPNDTTQLGDIFNPLVESLGVRFTRGSLVESSEGYESSDTGDHLALYVEPIGAYSDDDYIAGLYEITAAVTPFVFESWPGLDAYDICQEPRPEDDAAPIPPPATQVNMVREAAESYDWANGDLESMMRHAEAVGGESFSIVVAAPFNEVPSYAELNDAIFG
jgi:hypothetical protein